MSEARSEAEIMEEIALVKKLLVQSNKALNGVMDENDRLKKEIRLRDLLDECVEFIGDIADGAFTEIVNQEIAKELLVRLSARL